MTTKRLTNAELRQIIDSHEKGHAMVVPINCDYLAAKELLALREAQSVDFILGMDVSIDVSTCDSDAGHRLFGTVTEVSELDGAKNGYILLVQDAGANFTAPPAPAVQSDVEAVLALLESGEWAEHCTKTELGNRLESAITSMVGNMHPLPPDAVVAALTKGMERYNGAMLHLAGNSGIPAIPDGYKLVPIEPTESMINARREIDSSPLNMSPRHRVELIYRAMLTEAPTPTK